MHAGRPSIIELLCFNGANVNKQNRSKYVHSKLLLISNVYYYVRSFRCTPAMCALIDDRTSCDSLETICAFGADVDIACDRNQTPFTIAVERNRVDCVRLLLALNADTTKATLWGQSASLTNNTTIKQLVLEHSRKSVKILPFSRPFFNYLPS